MNRTANSFTRPLIAALLAATSLGQAAHAANGYRWAAPTEEIAEPDQLSLARQAVARGDNAEALSRYVRVLAVQPRDLDALVGAGNAAVGLGDFSAGLAFFGRAEEVDPHNGRVKAGLASALAQTEQPGAALKLFEEAVTLGVPEAEIAGDRGLAWDLRGNPRRAQRDYAMALANKPNDHEVTLRLALSQAISGDRDTAMRTLEPWLRKQDQGAWRTRAFVLAMTGDTKGASQAASAVLPAAQANAMAPFFARLASLNAGQKALASNFGYLPGDQPAAVQRALPASSAIAEADSKSRIMTTDRGAPRVAAAAAPSPAVTAVPTKVAAAKPLPVVSIAPARPAEGGPASDLAARPTVVAAAASPPKAKTLPIDDLASAAKSPKAGLAPVPPRPTQVATAAPAPKPVSVAQPTEVIAPVEAAPAPRQIALAPPQAAPVNPMILAAAEPIAARQPSVAPVSHPAAEPPAPASPTADVAAIRAETSADAEAEARAERALAEKAPPAPETKVVEARITPPVAPPPVTSSRPIEAQPRHDTEIAFDGPAGLPASVKSAEARGAPPAKPTVAAGPALAAKPRAEPGFALDEPAAQKPAAKLRAEPGFALDEPGPKGAVAKISDARAAPPKSDVPKPAAAWSSPRLSRIVGLPLPAEIARSFAAMPHGSALSADIVVDKAPAASKPASKKTELAADDPADAKLHKSAAAKLSSADADDDDARPAKSSDRDGKTAGKAAKDTDKLASRDTKTAGSEDKPGKSALADNDEKAKPSPTEKASKAKDAASGSSAKVKKALAESDAETKAASADGASRSRTASADGAAKSKTRSSDSSIKEKAATAEETTKPRPESESGAARPAGERYWVQVAGGTNKGDLEKAWTKLKGGPAGSALSGHTPSTTPLKTTNRLLVGPFTDTAEAQAFVNKLAGAGTSSFLFKSAPDQKVDRLHGP